MRSILVVDDDPDVRRTVHGVLTEAGYDVFTACDAQDALELLKAIDQPCVVLLDLLMPRADGWQFLSARRADPRLSRVPVVLLSASAHELSGAPLGVVGVLVKPINPDALLKTVAEYCGAKDRRGKMRAEAEREQKGSRSESFSDQS